MSPPKSQPKSRRRRTVRAVATTTAISAVGAGMAGGIAAARRWATGPDPTNGDPLGVPAGRRERVRTPDGAELSVIVLATPQALNETTIVLAHCWTGDHRVWGPVATRLVDRGHRVVLYDHRGHGASTVGTDGRTLSALGRDLRCVLEHLDLHDVVLAGHSMGGMAAQAYAIEHADSRRERLVSMVLVATASSALGADLAASMAYKLVGHPIADLALAGRRGNPFVRYTVGAHPSAVHLDAVRETFLTTEPASRVEFMSAMEAMDFDAHLGDLDLPVTVVCGTRDQLTPPVHSRRLAAVLPDARLQLLHGAGHMLPFEEPDRIAELIHSSATLQARQKRDGTIVLD